MEMMSWCSLTNITSSWNEDYNWKDAMMQYNGNYFMTKHSENCVIMWQNEDCNEKDIMMWHSRNDVMMKCNGNCNGNQNMMIWQCDVMM